MKEEVSNRTLAITLVIAIVISLTGTIISLNRLAQSRVPGITGFAIDTDVATATVQIVSTASISFKVNMLDFGTGMVNTSGGNTNCSLATGKTSGFKDSNSSCINFSKLGNLTSLVIENDGTDNMTINLSADKDLNTFVGGGGSGEEQFSWNITCNESATGCCSNLTNNGSLGSWATGWWPVNTTQTQICGGSGLYFTDDNDSILVNLNLTIPYDSPYAGEGQQSVTFTVAGATT